MNTTKKLLVAGIVGAGFISTTTAGTAQAAPLPIAQVPAVTTTHSGMLIPKIWRASIAVESTDVSGKVRISVPTPPDVCATTAGQRYMRVDFWNVSVNRGGSVTVNPCGFGYGNAPKVVDAYVNPGKITFTSHITPAPGANGPFFPATPGSGSFTAR
ncbi:hypothetical protein GCM10027289_13360 [Tsukamurella serpentis]